MKVVDYNQWREHVVMYDEYEAMNKYGCCMASTTFLVPGRGMVEQDLDTGHAVRVILGGFLKTQENRPSEPFGRNRKWSVRPKGGND